MDTSFFSWFKSLGRKQRGQWLDVSAAPPSEAEAVRKPFRPVPEGAESSPVQSQPVLRAHGSSPDSLSALRSRSASNSTPESSSAAQPAPPKHRHRRNQSDGTHVAKIWKQANASEPVCLEHFQMEKVLGKGGFGKVLLVTKKDTKELYALKVLRKADLIKRNQVEAAKTEHQLLHCMNHPFLTALHFAWQTEEKLYLCMNYCPGGELFFIRQQHGIFQPAQVRLYVAEIALAIGALHAKGFVYRDLKLENLLLDAEGHICLADFGLAKYAERCHTFCGTPEYVAPEMIQGKSYGREVDWWALGTLAYEMLVGAPPFFSRNQNVMYQKILRQPLTFPEHVSPSAQRIISDFMQKAPEARLGASVADVAAVQSHPYFRELDWEKVLRKGYSPVFRPLANSASLDLHATDNFDPAFTRLPATDSITLKPAAADTDAVSNLSAYFENFSYTRPEAILSMSNLSNSPPMGCALGA